MKFRWTIVIGCVLLLSCKEGRTRSQNKEVVIERDIPVRSHINLGGSKISERFIVPKGFRRIDIDPTSFGHYLRSLPLKEAGEKVKYFDGSVKEKTNVYDAVVDLPIGKRDLHQCADAVMRLRAEYFYSQKKYDSIHFNFTNGFRADYTNWRKGKRIVVSGHKASWHQSASPSDQSAKGQGSYESFWKYLVMVFSYAGTASLEKEMKSIPVKEIKIGDVFIKGGFPGHAVIVVDMAEHINSGETIFLLAQSYMPAQEIQILQNPNNKALSPWYSSEIPRKLHTPEWTFEKTDLKRFPD